MNLQLSGGGAHRRPPKCRPGSIPRDNARAKGRPPPLMHHFGASDGPQVHGHLMTPPESLPKPERRKFQAL